MKLMPPPRCKLQTDESLLAEQLQRLQAMRKQFDAADANKVVLLQTQSEIYLTLLAQTSTRIEAQQALGLLEDAIRHPIGTNDPSRERPFAKGKSD
jgi:cobalt-zinc-cadmium efflux system outer membrane protein